MRDGTKKSKDFDSSPAVNPGVWVEAIYERVDATLAFYAQLISSPEAETGLGFELPVTRIGGEAKKKGGYRGTSDEIWRARWKGMTCFWHVDIPGNLIMPVHYEPLCATRRYMDDALDPWNVIPCEFACLMRYRLLMPPRRRDIKCNAA